MHIYHICSHLNLSKLKLILNKNNVIKQKYIIMKCKCTFVSCCLAHLVRSAPVLATDSAVLVKSTAITSSHPVNLDLNIYIIYKANIFQ